MTGSVAGLGETPASRHGSARQAVQSVTRASMVLNTLGTSSRPLSILEVSQEIGLNRTIVYRLLRTLATEGLVSRNESGAYEIGSTAIKLGIGYLDRLPARKLALPYIADLGSRIPREYPWIVAFSTPVHAYSVIIDRIWNPITSLDSLPNLHSLLPMASSVTGRCVLATYPEQKAIELIGATEYQELGSRLAAIRQAGYFESAPSEQISGLHGIGAAILGSAGQAVGCVSVAAPSGVIQQLQEAYPVATEVKRTAQAVTQALDGTYR